MLRGNPRQKQFNPTMQQKNQKLNVKQQLYKHLADIFICILKNEVM
jgi:hypothetical protein